MRKRRGLFSFGRMIHVKTGRCPLLYNNYGNWCGAGGNGQPIDEVDKYETIT